MATTEAPCTPPSASLAAILSSAGAQAQCLLFSSSLSAEPRSVAQSRTVGDSSPSSDKENSPSPTLLKSNCASSPSPAMQSLLQISPAKHHVSFTPQRTRPLPRAWERRPATPFVPRNEGQKIWKRLPLQEINIDTNQQVPRREQEEKANYTRIVKRMRLDVENKIPMKQEMGVVVSAIGTKWEEENIEKGGSPKKKLRLQFTELTTANNSSVVGDEHYVGEQILATKEETAPGLSEAINNGQDPTDIENFSRSDQIDTIDVLQVNPDREEKGQNLIETTVFEPLLTSQHEALVPQESTIREGDLTTGQNLRTADEREDAENVSESSKEHSITIITECVEGTYEDITTPEELNVRVEDDATSDSDNLNTETTSNADLSYSEHSASFANTVTDIPSARLATIFTGPDHDETAFLRDFLERAQATKAAKIVLSPQKIPAILPPIVEAESADTDYPQPKDVETTDEIEDDDLSPPIETAQIQEMYGPGDLKANSPKRRSARAATRASSSRLPRFQMPSTSQFAQTLSSQAGTTLLPSTIQLKRATGNEFIFNAKSQQTLTMTTRSNTKRNQGEAIHVAQRLAQLKKEVEARQQEELVSEVTDGRGSSMAAVTLHDMAEDAVSTNKKRRREKQDAGKVSKIRRSVKWPSDEDLVQFRETSPFVDNSEAGSSSDEGTVLLLPAPEGVQPETVADIGTTTVSDNKVTITDLKCRKRAEVSEDSSKHKVRRIRKIKLDSVNGTPAPKTRSQTIAESDSSSSGARPSQDSAATLTSDTDSRRSRMPVPTSTSIPLPSLTAAKSKTKSTEPAKDKLKLTTSSLPTMKASKDKEANTVPAPTTDSKLATSTMDASEPDRRLDGRRRLRVRG